MRTQSHFSSPSADHARHSRGAFTLVEVLITMATLVMVLGGAMATYLYGLKMVQFLQPKLNASDNARKAVAQLTDDIRCAYSVDVGFRTNSAFVKLPSFSYHQGDALRVYPSINTNQFVVYFLDPADKRLKRVANNSTFATVMASGVTNALPFTAEDFRGRVLTNDVGTFVVGVTVQFNQLHPSSISIGPGSYYDSYQLRSKVTKRSF
jgi:type II secretory pathway pseudopilin PulG